jgi:hypothetical protein
MFEATSDLLKMDKRVKMEEELNMYTVAYQANGISATCKNIEYEDIKL